MTSGPERFVIIGGGLAGAKAAETLRDEGFDGRLVLIGDESERPYERPPLSKDYLRGETAEVPYVHGESFYRDNDVELWTSSRVTGIDAGLQELLIEGDRHLGYDRLLVATGSIPRRLDVPGANLDGILYLRTRADSDELARRIEADGHLVVVGSGWIGAEIAASARQRGCKVTMIEMGSLPLEHVLGPEVGQIYLGLHRDHGVEFLPETTVARFEGEHSVERVVTSDGAEVEANFVVVGIGIAPRTGLLEGGHLEINDGLAVNERLESSTPGIFAAGDVAHAWHPFYKRSIRVEHWANALNQGPAAAKAMLGQDVSYDEIPYFFSDQYDTGMEYSGYATDWDEVVFRGDPAEREFIAFWLKDERVIAGMNMNVWDVSDPIRELIRSRRPVTRRDLADPDVSLSHLAEPRARRQARPEALSAWASEGGAC
jgi:3-phenylpropionate/trans-cinnamate dioxygenase ferredoxin reductase component